MRTWGLPVPGSAHYGTVSGDSPLAEAVLVDTDILIDVGRGSRTAVEFLEILEQSGQLVISIVTQMELIVGCRNKDELHIVDNSLRRSQIIPIDEPTSQRAVGLLREFRLGHGLLIADSLIAATALDRNCSLATGKSPALSLYPQTRTIGLCP